MELITEKKKPHKIEATQHTENAGTTTGPEAATVLSKVPLTANNQKKI